MSKYNYCFNGTTPIIYRESPDSEIIIESIKSAYDKCADKTVYVCVHEFDENEHTSKISWQKATFCHTISIQQVTIFMEPEEIGGLLESDNIIRVTPNHIFPILTKNGYKNVEAYLLQTGDKIISERCRKYVENVDSEPMFDEEGNPVIDWVLEDNSTHYIDYRHITKVYNEDIDSDSSIYGTDFYGVVLNGDSPTKFFMLCNSVISHDSSID